MALTSAQAEQVVDYLAKHKRVSPTNPLLAKQTATTTHEVAIQELLYLLFAVPDFVSDVTICMRKHLTPDQDLKSAFEEAVAACLVDNPGMKPFARRQVIKRAVFRLLQAS